MKKILLSSLLFLSGFSFGQVPSYVPTNGLVGWWGFNGNANDESGNGNNGTVNGATLTTDRFSNANSAYDFDGVDDLISVGNFSSNVFEENFSVSMWCSFDNFSNDYLHLIYGENSYIVINGNGPLYSPNDSKISAYQGPLTPFVDRRIPYIQTSDDLLINQYYHFALVKKDSDAYIFLNGILTDTVAADNSLPIPVGNTLFIGSGFDNSMNYHMDGTLDDIGIWNRALTQCEISELYHAQQFSQPVLAISDTTSACGASTTLDAGTDPAWASYLWNTTEDTQTISVSNSGLYTVEVTDTNGCIGYDTTLVSIIDPTIDQIDTNICIGDSLVLGVSFEPFITYLGGSDRDEIREIVTDIYGNVYVYGVTWSADFPTTNGAFQSSLNGITDLFLSKFSHSGELLWSTLIGGSGQENAAYGEKAMTIDHNGDIYIGGGSSSSDYPTTPGVYQNTNAGGADAILSKFNSNGSLIWSTYYGGTAGESINGIAINENNDVLITGYTYSINLPVTPGVYQTTGPNNPSNNNDMFTVKFDENGNRDWASFYGNNNTGCNGGPYEDAQCITKHGNNIAFGGYLTTYNLSTTPDAFHSGLQGGCLDMFYSIFNNSGQRLYATYFGGNGNDNLLKLNSNNQFLFLGGVSNSTNLPMINSHQAINSGNYDAVYACFDLSNNLVWSTYLGGSGDDNLKNQILQNDILYGVGVTASANFPTTDNSVANNGGSDFFITNFDLNGQLLLSKVDGGNGDDVGHGIVKNAYGTYIAGFTSSTSGLASSNAYDSTYNGGLKDGFLAFYPNSVNITWSTGDTTSSITVQPTTTTTYSVTVSDGISSCVDDVTITVNDPQVDAGVDVNVCNGDDITLSGSGADTYAWSGGITDGVAFGPTVSEYYYVTGTDTLGCQAIDSVYITMLQPTTSSITETICDTYTAPDGATYTSTGNYTAVIPNAVGCDSTITIDLTITNSTSSSITETVCDTYTAPDGATYTSTGNYTAVIPNAIGCDSTITIDLTVNALTALNGGADITVCEGDSVVLSGSGAQSYAWNNGVTDGTYFTPALGTTTYTVTGTDANGCNDTDDVTVTVSSTPVLTLTATSPDCQGEATGLAQANVTGGTNPYDFVWSNGALTSTNANIAAGSYSVTVTDNAGCEATGTVVVTDSSDPCFFIPGGLSPNGDNNNDTWGVAGLNNYPEAKVMVYNRWGQLLYDAGPDDAPWDGTYLGEELPTADYYYIIDLGNGDTFNGVVTLKR